MNYFEGRTASSRSMYSPGFGGSQTPAPDVMRFVAEGLLKPLVDGLNTALTNFADTMGSSGASSSQATQNPVMQSRTGMSYQHPHHHHGCGCGHRHHEECGCRHHHERCGCERDRCHCNCCIVDADLVVYARVGEIRVVPIFLENSWRRERKIVTELSPFTTRGGKPAPVTGKLLPPAPEFTLPPCGHQTLILSVEIGAVDRENPRADVDDCTVAYADLRLQGCDVRPIRIAVAILPRDCEAYEIECGCCCC